MGRPRDMQGSRATISGSNAVHEPSGNTTTTAANIADSLTSQTWIARPGCPCMVALEHSTENLQSLPDARETCLPDDTRSFLR